MKTLDELAAKLNAPPANSNQPAPPQAASDMFSMDAALAAQAKIPFEDVLASQQAAIAESTAKFKG